MRILVADVYSDGTVRLVPEGDRAGGVVLSAGETLEITFPVEHVLERRESGHLVEGLIFCDRCDGWGTHKTDEHEEPAGNGAAWVLVFAVLFALAALGCVWLFAEWVEIANNSEGLVQ